MRHALHRLFALTLALAPLPLWAGCGGAGGENICSMRCDCEGCSPAEFDNCVADYAGDEQEASYRECLPQYDELLACQEATAFCKGHEFETSCKPERDRWKDCTEH